MPKIEHRMTLLMSSEDRDRLRVLSERQNVSKCCILRQLIYRAALMQINRVPTCVDGRPCLCPQIHGHAPTVPGDPDEYLKSH